MVFSARRDGSERVQLLNRTINEIVQDEAVRQKLAQLGFDAFSGPPEEFAQFVQEQYLLWGKLINDANLGPHNWVDACHD